MISVICLGTMMGAMAIGVPIAFALLFSSAAVLLWMGMFDPQIISQKMIDGVDSFQLLAVPFFVLAGELMNAGGLSRRLIRVAMALVGHYHGGIGYVAIVTAVIMAAMSGSAAADAAALAAILIPMMRQANYDLPLSAGLISSGGIIAPVIPPSIGFIIFGVAANVSIPGLFIGGIVPGLLFAASLAVTWWIVSRKRQVAVQPRASRAELRSAVIDGVFALLMPVIIIGSIRTGVVTPTEAAVIAVAYALAIDLLFYRELTWAKLYEVAVRSALTTASVMFMVGASLVSGWIITLANVPESVGIVLNPLIDDPILLMLVMMTIIWLIGTALDFTPTILIMTPILMPIVNQAHIDPIYFGVIFIMTNAIGLITPPVGIVLNVVCSVTRIPMMAVIRGCWPFIVAQTAVVILLILFPQLVTVPLHWLRG